MLFYILPHFTTNNEQENLTIKKFQENMKFLNYWDLNHSVSGRMGDNSLNLGNI